MNAILSGQLRPGDRLVEMRIAREAGVSQAPVREALRELEALGFVEHLPNRGTFVSDFWRRGLMEIYKVRGALEEMAARIATPALRESPDELQKQVDLMCDAARDGDVEGIVEHSVRFHRIIVEASDTRLLLRMWEGLNVEDHTNLTMRALGLDLMAIASSHQPIVDAIVAGDVETACRRSREHQDYFTHLPISADLGADLADAP